MAARPDPLAGAKAAVSKANALQTAADPKGLFTPKSAPVKPKVISKPVSKQQAPSTWGPATIDIIRNGGKLPEMHKGGKVPGKPGDEKVVKLEAGEKVIPAKDKGKMADEKKDKVKKADSAESKPLSVKEVLSKDKSAHSMPSGKKSKKSAPKHTHIEHHSDGSHTVRHTPAGGGEEVSYSRPDLESMLQGVRDNVGSAGQQQQEEPEEAPEQAPPAAGGAAPQA